MPHLANARGQRFPIWIVAFWKKLLFMRNVQTNWCATQAESNEPLMKDLGHEKHRKKPNTFYKQLTFWRHNDSSDFETE